MDMTEILKGVADGSLSVDDAAQRLQTHAAETDLSFARVDLDRAHRRGFPEVIYGPGKTSPQIVEIVTALRRAGQDVLVTRVEREQFDAIHRVIPGTVYHETARLLTLDVATRPVPIGLVAVVSAGTSDIPVAEEAALTAERMGAKMERIYDVGVAGLHRLARRLPLIRQARVVVVVAGMEGALPSVLGGLIDKPIIAVPTSIGYGTGAHGQAALLAMLNSCVPGITVVNIDNGFGAGVAAALINRAGEPPRAAVQPT